MLIAPKSNVGVRVSDPLSCGDLVTQARQFHFLREQRLPRGYPFVPGYDAMLFGVRLGNGGSVGYPCVHFALAPWLSVMKNTYCGAIEAVRVTV